MINNIFFCENIFLLNVGQQNFLFKKLKIYYQNNKNIDSISYNP